MDAITPRNLYATATASFVFGAFLAWVLSYGKTCIGPLKPFDAPAWIQAIGGLIGLGIAIAIPTWAAMTARTEKRAKERLRVKRAEAILHPALTELSRRLGNFIESYDDKNDDPQLNFNAVDGDFEAVTPKIVEILTSNEDMGEIGPDVCSLVVQLSSYEAWINAIQDVMNIGYNNHLLRTEAPERVRRAREILENSYRLIARIEAEEDAKLQALFGAEYCRH